MIQVTIRRLRASLTGASGLVLLANADAGCAAPVGPESIASTSGAIAATQPSVGSLTLTSTYVTLTPSVRWAFNAQGPVDEFLRVGDTLAVDLPAFYLWEVLHPEGAALPDVTELRGLNVQLDVQSIAGQDVVAHTPVAVSSWSGTTSSDLVGRTGAFTIPPGTDTLVFSLVIVDPSDSARVELASLDFETLPVFGGSPTNKHVLFDNDFGTLRDRVVEGGTLTPDLVALTYTDWRADELVSRSALDLKIGTIDTYSRFGQVFAMPIYGQIAYEISVGSSYAYLPDGSTTPVTTSWYETTLTPNATSRLLMNAAGRTAYEETLYLPPTATDLQLYFHVKAYVVADYSVYTASNLQKRYPQGGKILLAESYDNPAGKSFSNYDFAVAAP